MTRQQLTNILERKIAMLNRLIDARIVAGIPYPDEAREHKMLLSQLRKIRAYSFFNRSLSFLHLF